MDLTALFDFLLAPALIFLARIIDVTLGTVKIILVSKGVKRLSSILAFFEILVWLLALSRVFENLGNTLNFIAYAGGFAAGTYVGMVIEEKIALGTTVVEVITRRNPDCLVEYLRQRGFAVTRMRGEGYDGPVHMLYSIVKRKKLSEVIYIIREFNPTAFYTIKDIRYVSEAVGPLEEKKKMRLKNSINKYKCRSIDSVKRTRERIKSRRPILAGKLDWSLKKFRKKL